MRVPVDACDFFGIELYFFMQRSAQRVQHGAFHGAAQRLGIDDQTAVMRGHQALHPNTPSPDVHFDFCNLRNYGLTAVRPSSTRQRTA